MRILLFIILLIESTFTFSQNEGYVSSVEISAGLLYPNKSKFGNPIQSSFNEAFESQKQFVALKIEHPRNYSKQNLGAEIGINYYLNQTKSIGDTVKLNWFANTVYAVYKYDLIPKNTYIDVLLCGGGQLGAQRLIINDGTNTVYKNFNAAIIPQVEIKIQPIKRFCFGVQANYIYDLTKGAWKKKTGNDFVIDDSKFSGFSVNAYLAWCWNTFY